MKTSSKAVKHPVLATEPAPGGPRERLLDVAGRLFNEEGVRAVGIDRILAESGVAKASLYKHFPSKDDLIVAWLQRRGEASIQPFLRDAERPGRTPRERVLGVFDVLGAWIASPTFRGCNFINTSAELADPHHPARHVALAHKQRMRDHLRSLASSVAPARADALASQLFLLIEGAVVASVMKTGKDPVKDARAAAAALLDEATRASPRSRG